MFWGIFDDSWGDFVEFDIFFFCGFGVWECVICFFEEWFFLLWCWDILDVFDLELELFVV